MLRTHPSVGFILFGDGPERTRLQQQINAAGLNHTFILSGFRADLDRFLPHFDLLVLPSYTEGLPNVVLEAFAAGVPVVGTAVGGTTEVIEDGVSGHLVPAGDADTMAERIAESLANADKLPEMGRQGRRRVQGKFGFSTQARLYHELFVKLCPDAPSAKNREAERCLESQTDRAESALLSADTTDDDLFAMGATWDR